MTEQVSPFVNKLNFKASKAIFKTYAIQIKIEDETCGIIIENLEKSRLEMVKFKKPERGVIATRCFDIRCKSSSTFDDLITTVIHLLQTSFENDELDTHSIILFNSVTLHDGATFTEKETNELGTLASMSLVGDESIYITVMKQLKTTKSKKDGSKCSIC